MLQINNEQDIADLKTEHNEYFQQISEQLQKNQLTLAATALRFILESVVKTYIIKYSPEDALLNNTFTELQILEDKKIIDSASARALHSIRKTANKGAHNERNNLTKNEIQIAIAPMKRETQLLYAKLEDSLPRKDEQTYKSNNASSPIDYRYILCPNCSKSMTLIKGQSRGLISCNNCKTKYLFQSQDAQGNYIDIKRIVTCPSCNQNISLPINQKRLAVTCSSCNREFIVESIGSIQQRVNGDTVSLKNQRTICCPQCLNHMLLLKGQLKGQLVCNHCMTKYFFQFQDESSDIFTLKRIVPCTNCGKNLSIPISQNRGIVTCSSCNHEFAVEALHSKHHSSATTSSSSKTTKKSLVDILSVLSLLLIIAYTAYIIWKSDGGKIESTAINWTVAIHYVLLGSIHTLIHPFRGKNLILNRLLGLVVAIPINAFIFIISIFIGSLFCTILFHSNLSFIIFSSAIYIVACYFIHIRYKIF